jgi:hypothetical protein
MRWGASDWRGRKVVRMRVYVLDGFFFKLRCLRPPLGGKMGTLVFIYLCTL